MRSLFLVLAKVVGLAILYWVLLAVTQMLSFGLTSSGSVDVGSLLPALQTAVIGGLMLWILLFKTEGVADVLGLPRDEAAPKVESDGLLRVGAQLLGVYVLVTQLPLLITQSLGALRETLAVEEDGVALRSPFPSDANTWWAVVPHALAVVLGLYLCVRPRRVARWLGDASLKQA